MTRSPQPADLRVAGAADTHETHGAADVFGVAHAQALLRDPRHAADTAIEATPQEVLLVLQLLRNDGKDLAAGSPLVRDVASALRALRLDRQALASMGHPRPLDEIAVDDMLYQRGLLAPLPPRHAEREDCSGMTALAVALRTAIAFKAEQIHKRQLGGVRSAWGISQREYEREHARMSRYHETWPRDWADTVAAAVEGRQVDFLLHVLDNDDDPDDWQRQVTREVLARECGLPTAWPHSRDRTRRIFAFCGMDEVRRSEHLVRRDAAREEAMRRCDAWGRAQAVFWITPDRRGTMPAGQLIDRLVAQGYVEIAPPPPGMVLGARLRNPQTNSSYRLSRADGTYQYAQIALQRQRDTERSQEERIEPRSQRSIRPAG